MTSKKDYKWHAGASCPAYVGNQDSCPAHSSIHKKRVHYTTLPVGNQGVHSKLTTVLLS
jgi:hypothetical protein